MILAMLNRSSFRVHEYCWYWAGNVLVHITFLLQAVALGWHMLEVTGSPFQVGLVASAYGAPLLLVSPLSGVLADRMKRQWVVQSALAFAVLASAALALVAATGGTSPLQILVTSLALGTAFAFYAPARMALLPNLVPNDMVFNATTLSYSGTRLMGFFGPVLAGTLLDLADIALTLMVQTALFAIGAALYFKGTRYLPRPKRKRQAQSGILGGFAEVIAYLRRDRALFALTTLALVFVPIGMPYQKLMPIFVDQVLSEGPAMLGLLVGSASLGLGALRLYRRSHRRCLSQRSGDPGLLDPVWRCDGHLLIHERSTFRLGADLRHGYLFRTLPHADQRLAADAVAG